MRKTLHLLLLFAFSISFSQNVSVSQAISITNKQCMLSQRMANDKMFKLAEQKVGSVSQPSSSVIQFEQNMEILGRTSFSPKITKELKTVELLWEGYKKLILNNQTSLNRKMIVFNDIMLEANTKVNKALLLEASLKKIYPYNEENPDFVAAYIGANDIKVLSQKLPFYLSSQGAMLFTNYNENFSKRVLDLVEKMNENIEAISIMEETNENIALSVEDVVASWLAVKSNLDSMFKEGVLTLGNSSVSAKTNSLCNQLLKDADVLVRTLKSTSDIN